MQFIFSLEQNKMKSKRFLKIIIVSLLLIFTSLSVYGDEKGVGLYGVGKNTCAEFLLATKNTPVGGEGYITRGSEKLHNEASVYMNWVYGYFSAHNFFCRDNQISKTLTESLDAWLRHYCDKNPNQSFFNALYAYTNEEGYEKICSNSMNFQTVVPQGKGDAIIHPPSAEHGIK